MKVIFYLENANSGKIFNFYDHILNATKNLNKLKITENFKNNYLKVLKI